MAQVRARASVIPRHFVVLTVNLCFKVSDLLRKLFPFSCKLKEIMPLGTTKLSKSSKSRTQHIINIQRKDIGMSKSDVII